MIDLHTHTIFSDGALIVSELVRRAEAVGYRAIGITDHADHSNLDLVVPRVVAVAREINRHNRIRTLAGIELTHVPPAAIAELAEQARFLGAQLVLVHGETIVEPVAPGTNRAALEADIDILAHPGLITDEDAALAAARNIALEISGRKGHSFTNGHVVRQARAAGCRLVFGSDAHDPGDLLPREMARQIMLGAGLSPQEIDKVFADCADLVEQRQGE